MLLFTNKVGFKNDIQNSSLTFSGIKLFLVQYFIFINGGSY